MITPWGEWDGVCACGKTEMDGVTCRFGASHRPLLRLATTQKALSLPWEKPQLAFSGAVEAQLSIPKMPWE
jgi:hypothetical protein